MNKNVQPLVSVIIPVFNGALYLIEAVDSVVKSTYKNIEIILIDELLTPDSSRFWPLEGYQPGMASESFDKQYVRDYLLSLNWDTKPPAPSLPAEIVQKTQEKYAEALRRLTTPPERCFGR